MKKLPVLLGFVVTFCFTFTATWAQEPAGTAIYDEEAVAPARPLPEVPETTIVGRPDAFPANPLGENVVVTPARTETFASSVGSSLSVITRQEIADTGQTQVAEVLRTIPGLDVVQQGSPGGLTSVFMRGANSQHTKVLIDGIPVNDPSNAARSFDFSHLSVDNIERIEVLRGPQSTLYGSDAIGGVINIITTRGEGPLRASASFMAGQYGTLREGVNLSGGTSRFHYSFGASYLESDGFSAADVANGNVEADGIRSGNLSGRFGWTPAENFDIDYVFRFNDLDADIDDAGFIGPPTDNLIRQSRDQAFFNRVQARWAVLDGLIEQKVGFSLTDYDRRDTDPGFWGIPAFQGQTRMIDYQCNLGLTDWNTFTFGVDYLDEEASNTFTPQLGQNLASIYFQDQIQVGDNWFTTVGFRWDDHSEAGSASTYRVTTLYNLPGPALAFHGSIGTGFRVPSLAENLFPWGNPALRPEKSKGWDAGLRKSFYNGRLTVDGTYFRNDYVDLIQFDFNTFSLENIGRAFSSGVELTSRWQANRCTTITANYTHTLAEDVENRVWLRRRPRHKASLTVNRRLLCDRANVNLSCLFVGQRNDSPDESIILSEYFLMNMGGSYDLNDRWQLFARVDNLLDQDYQEVYGYGVAGISGYGGVNVRF